MISTIVNATIHYQEQQQLGFLIFLHAGAASIVMPATIEVGIGCVEEENEENGVGEVDGPAVKDVGLADEQRNQKDVDL